MTATAILEPELEIDCIDLEAGFISEAGEELCVGGRIMGTADGPTYAVLGGISADRQIGRAHV